MTKVRDTTSGRVRDLRPQQRAAAKKRAVNEVLAQDTAHRVKQKNPGLYPSATRKTTRKGPR